MIARLAIIYLVALIFFVWGIATFRFEIFPYSFVYPVAQNVFEFIRGHDDENTTLAGKLLNDAGIVPMRTMGDFQRIHGRPYNPLEIDGLNKRRQQPEIYAIPGQMAPGYKFIFGVIDFEKQVHGAILLDKNQRVVHTWKLNDEDTQLAINKHNEINRTRLSAEKAEAYENVNFIEPERRFPHGIVLLSDGSIIYIDGDNSNGIMRVDACSKRLWTTIGKYDHAVHPANDDNSVWAVTSNNFSLIDKENGEIQKKIFLKGIAVNNPDNDVLYIRKHLGKGEDLNDPHHVNDIEPLPAKYAGAFPMFEAGDLLTSLRSLDLIFVFDQDTLKIKWWRTGQFRRQHDPDWQPNGTISVYENYMRDKYSISDQERFSRIWSINPSTYDAEVIYDGKNDEFYSSIRGKHQVLPNGNILISSPNQGRVLEVTQNGETVFDFINIYDETRSLLISEAIWVPENYFNIDFLSGTYCK